MFSKPFISSLAALAALHAGLMAEVEFNRDIRPILTKDCTACHGGVKAAGGISFIYRDMALSEGDSGKRAIVPGKPEESEMIRRMRHSDPDEVMPKPKHGPPLAEEKIQLIEQWIREGAEWQEHWSFVPPKHVAVEKVSDESWPSQPLDRYVLKRLDEEGLKPSAEAPPAEWLRQVSFDLIGLPPTLDELKTFEQAHARDPQAAREEVVDRLLASPHYGERWAVVWMDLARYSDTFGFEKDPGRTIWPWRDWLIRAFNADMPYDQFTIEQLAGDLLPEPTADQRLATAFHRNTQNNTEGGTDDEEFRVAAVMDRVATTWTAWQATTFGCVQCHAHPYDPIEHEEYYKFTAFFNNTEDHDLDSDYPWMKVPEEAQLAERTSELELRMHELRVQLNADGHRLLADADQWRPFTPDEFSPTHGELQVTSDGSIRASGTLPVLSAHVLSGPVSDFQALRLDILPESDDPTQWPERGSMVKKLELRLIDAQGESTPIKLKEAFADKMTGVKALEADGNLGAYPKLHEPRWFVVVPEKPVVTRQGDRLEIKLQHGYATAGSQATPVRRFTVKLSNDGSWRKLVEDSTRQATWQRRAELEEEYKAINGAMVPIMVEGPKRETRLFARGNRLSKEQAVEPGIPKLFGGQSGPDMNRLDMAKWLVSEDNPLTARVMVNRLWQQLFDLGLVETVEDFGTSGTPPSHPALLDHLALRFQFEHDWSIKAMLREIVLSSTYRQSHKATPELLERDPRNELLARGPRKRLSAEMVRDQALAVGGILSDKMHGPSVFPPQPAGVWKSVYNGKKWKESKGADRVRRAVYTYHKRTAPHPAFLTFDAPSRDLCTARRITSNTPLQALVTMNDPAHIEAAQGFAKRMQEHSPKLAKQLSHGMFLATQREADSSIIGELEALYREAAEDYRTHPEEAKHLADTPEEAAMVLVANTILNLDAALTR
ncbi:MAG: PSD1 and planctomycete cytochrome C domain-containing protein [Akkermansiaceae bacterium]|nr:PSD1 and planctomycete cytochrome C domain-containing protein [Akkermansiaceae bacterium]